MGENTDSEQILDLNPKDAPALSLLMTKAASKGLHLRT